MKVLVGTLYCGEGDFDKCVKSIQSQDYPLEHLVISDKEEHLAHYELYSAIRDRKADMLVKVDADMVLKNSGVVRKFVQIISSGLLRVTYHVDDFFTGVPIQGIHALSKDIVIPDRKYFESTIRTMPDRIPIDKARTRRFDQSLAWHCYHSNEKQAFHFGFHRYLKKSNDKCINLYKNWKSNDLPLLRMACLGMVVAHGMKLDSIYCYGEDFDNLFEEHKHDADGLRAKIVRSSIRGLQC